MSYEAARSEFLAAWFHVVDILAPEPRARMRLAPLKLVLLTVLDLCLFFMPDPRLLDTVSLFLTDERSDAAVVGSGNKAMGTSPLLTF